MVTEVFFLKQNIMQNMDENELKTREKSEDLGAQKAPLKAQCSSNSSFNSQGFLNNISFSRQGSEVVVINWNEAKAKVIKYNGNYLDFRTNKNDKIIQYNLFVGDLGTPSEEMLENIAELVNIHKLEAIDFLKNIRDLSPSPVESASLEFSENKLDMATFFLDKQPLFFDKSKTWWMWDYIQSKWSIVDETTILSLISSALCEKKETTTKSKAKTEILEALKQLSRKRQPKDFPTSWIQFNNIIVDVKTGKEFKASPDYFCVNPIPWKLAPSDVNEEYDCPTIDRLFREWVIGGEQDEKYIDLLYELFAYSLLADNPLQKWIIWSGSGANGKGACSRLLSKFVGDDNVSSTFLEDLTRNRFETTALYNKLVCYIQEASANSLKSSTLIKAATGQDKIKGEFKFGGRFEFTPYATIIMPTNSVPINSDDSDAWYRRLLLLDFPNKFKQMPKGEGVLGKQAVEEEVPDWEFGVLARRCVGVLQRLLERGYFLNEQTVKKTKKKYIFLSNPVAHFVEENCVESAEDYLIFSEFVANVNGFLEKHSTYSSLNRKAISKRVKSMGYKIERKRDVFDVDGLHKDTVKHVIFGLKWKSKSNNTNLSAEMKDCFAFLGGKEFKKSDVAEWFDSKKSFLGLWETYFDDLVKSGVVLEPKVNVFVVGKQ